MILYSPPHVGLWGAVFLWYENFTRTAGNTEYIRTQGRRNPCETGQALKKGSTEKTVNCMNRREAREQAFLLVFEKTFKNDPLPEIIEAAILARDLEVDEFSNRVAAGVVEHLEEIDSSIEKNIIGWKKNRLSRVVVSVLRVAVYEMLYEKDIPVSVSINEALEIAKKYGGQDDAPYINGVLGAVYKEIGEKA